MDVPGPSAPHLASNVLALAVADRRQLTLDLLWSLPRDEMIEIHSRLSQMMQKDIVGQLPPELSLRILSLLEPDDLLKCKAVSRTWTQLCDDQSLWLDLCRSHSPPIEPTHTTWNDLTLHRQLLTSGGMQPPASFGDESFEYNSDEDASSFPSPFHGQPQLGITQSGPGAVVPGTPTGRGGISHGLRRMVWERPSGGLPTYQRAPNARSPTRTPAADPLPEPPILSHQHIPTALPKVNYKHLYLVRRILQTRMTDTRPADVEASVGGRRAATTWNPTVKILSSISSTQAGGLPGHSESIYSLHLFRRHMRVTMTTGDADDFMYGLQTALNMVWPKESHSDVFGTPVSASWPTVGGSPRSNTSKPGAAVIQGRDWLLSGSRDQTLRLWQMDTPQPRVVKIFSGGHAGSILTHFVTEITVPSSHGPQSPSSPKRKSRSPLKSPAKFFSTSPTSKPGSPKSLAAGMGFSTRASSATPAASASSSSSPVTPPMKRLIAVSGGLDGRICLWDIEHGDGTPEKVIEAHTDSVLFVRGDEEHIVSCSKDLTIRLFDIHTLEQKLCIAGVEGGHRSTVNAVGLTKDFIISASGDHSIKVWDIRDGRLLATIDAHVRGISCIGFEPAPSSAAGWVPEVPGSVLRGTVVTGSSDSTIKTFHLVQLPPGRDAAVTFRDMLSLERGGGDLDSDMNSLEEGDGADQHWEDDESDTDDPDASAAARRHRRLRMAIQPGVEYRAMCSCPLTAARSPNAWCMRCLNHRGHTDLVRSIHLTETVTLTASYDSTIKMWDRITGRLIFDFQNCHTGRVFAITGDRMRVVSAGLDARITVVDFSEGLDTAFV